MKKSLKRLIHHQPQQRRKHDHKHSRIQGLAKLDELAQASQDMEDMKECYDSLLSAAALATNGAYEFSESLQEMGVCLLQKIQLNDDEHAGKVMMMLGKLQFQLQKVLDTYRAHICQTITVPSESLLNEIHTLEEMKHQCDEKRESYEYMRTRCRGKGKPKSGKEETFSSEQLQSAKDEFDEEATLFVFRLKSLKRGQSRSLLTQTARHHAAQLSFFRKGLNALEVVEPHVKWVAEQQHIDFQFSGLDYESQDDENDDNDGEDSDGIFSGSSVSSEGDDGELSFDYRHNNWLHNATSAVRTTMELELDKPLPSVSRGYFEKENVKVGYEESCPQEIKMISQSAPLFPQRKLHPADRIRQLQPSATRKFCSYALPKPGDSKISISNGCQTCVSHNKPSPQGAHNLYHSCPLEPKKFGKLEGTENLSGPILPNPKIPNTILKESDNNRMPPPLTERISSPLLISDDNSRTKKPKLQSFSGPITSKHLSTKASLSAKNSVLFKEGAQFSSGPVLRVSIPQSSSSPKGSRTPPINIFSSPRISELHELPRPPANTIYSSGRPSGMIGFSAPLLSRSPDNSTTKKWPVPKTPLPPLAHSNPISSPRTAARSAPSKPSETSQSSDKSDVTASPPSTQNV